MSRSVLGLDLLTKREFFRISGRRLGLIRFVESAWLNYACRRRYRQRSRGNVRHHHGIRADLRAVSDLNVAHDHRSSAERHPPTELGRIVGERLPGRPDCHALANHTFVTDLGELVNHDPTLVGDHNPLADRGCVVKLDPVVVSHQPVQEPIQDAQRHPQQPRLDRHPPDAEAVHRQGPKPRAGPFLAVVQPILSDLVQQVSGRAGHDWD